jgi:toxin HigB-1
VIKSFAKKETREIFETGTSRRWNSIARVAVRKLVQIDSVTTLDDLNIPPGNRLEALKGDRAGLHSIRISDQCAINGASVSDGRAMASTMWKLSITTNWEEGNYEHHAS